MYEATMVEQEQAVRRAPTKRIKETPLTEADWVDAATDILVRDNVRGIKIDALCAKLGVTKGSFYHHFSGRQQLLGAILSKWRKRMTLNVIQNIARRGAASRDRLRALIALPGRSSSSQAGQVEQSIRDWSRRVKISSDAVQEVDEIRLNYFIQILTAEGLSPEQARLRAYIAYCIMMGDSILLNSVKGMDHNKLADEVVAMLLPDGQQDKSKDK